MYVYTMKERKNSKNDTSYVVIRAWIIRMMCLLKMYVCSGWWRGVLWFNQVMWAKILLWKFCWTKKYIFSVGKVAVRSYGIF